VRQLGADPGVTLVSGLIFEFRASMVVGTLRLTSRLMLLALGQTAFRTMLIDYCRKIPPQMYGFLEAEAFGRYLRELRLEVPHLTKVLEFEQATLATLSDDQRRVVSFDFEPLPLLRALAEGRLPTEAGVPGQFEIELTGDNSQAGLANVESDAMSVAFPFH
jgi:hypothetical protein